jgi:DNA-binding GntR family transcriptional regulator
LAGISERPAYERVADDLRGKIAAGTYAVGDALPSTQALMSSYAVSSTVARRAVSELRNEGLVIGQPGKAVFVKATPESSESANASPEYLAIASQLSELKAAVADSMAAFDARIQRLEDAARAAGVDLRQDS